MSKSDNIPLTGVVTEVLPGAMCRIRLDEFPDKEIIGYISGKMKQHKIKVIVGDEVDVEVSPYDLSKGRITKRR